MTRLFLHEMVEGIAYEDLPESWKRADTSKFSRTKSLWEYQQVAIKNSIKALWKYYSGGDNEEERKVNFFKWYCENGLNDNLDIPVAKSPKLAQTIEEFYTVVDNKIDYQQMINRACFWMATGSGKTLVLVKLIEVLCRLVKSKNIPQNDILVLSCRDDLLEQLKEHVHDFNAAQSDLTIDLRELKEYAEAKRHSPSLFKDDEVTVFYYRSDNISDEQKEKIIDFRNYDDNGKWYVLLDEAHKGDREDSKRQHLYSILSRNGFLFNFSATFTDPRDLVTTVYNFNLSEFIRAGYGKHIAILEHEMKAFKDKEDFSNEAKQKIVLKSLLMLAYARKASEMVQKIDKGLYHKPLILTLVNSVNTDEADLKMFFVELERIAEGKVPARVWNAARDELWDELRLRPAVMFEYGRTLDVDEKMFCRPCSIRKAPAKLKY